MKVLFVCNQGMHRSRTAAEIFKGRLKTKFAGLFSEHPVSKQQMQWADTIVVMEDFQRHELTKRFPNEFMQKKVLTLGIPDIYAYGQSELVKTIKEKMIELFQPLVELH